MHRPATDRPSVPARRGFTLTELIVVMAIIAVLLALILTGLGAARGAADRTDLSNSLRQMLAGWSGYTSDHDGGLMPGYVSVAGQNQLQLRVTGPRGENLGGTEDASSFVWRLADYLGSWEVMTTGYDTSVVNFFQSEVESGTPIYGPASATGAGELGFASAPAIGMNTMFVGGDDTHFLTNDDAVFGNRDPWSDRFRTQAATRLADIKNPAALIVFAPAVRFDTDTWAAGTPIASGRNLGAAVVVPPQLTNAGGATPADPTDDVYWTASSVRRFTGDVVDPAPGGAWSGDTGVPINRATDRGTIPVGRADGSVSVTSVGEVSLDPRAWDPKAIGARN